MHAGEGAREQERANKTNPEDTSAPRFRGPGRARRPPAGGPAPARTSANKTDSGRHGSGGTLPPARGRPGAGQEAEPARTRACARTRRLGPRQGRPGHEAGPAPRGRSPGAGTLPRSRHCPSRARARPHAGTRGEAREQDAREQARTRGGRPPAGSPGPAPKCFWAHAKEMLLARRISNAPQPQHRPGRDRGRAAITPDIVRDTRRSRKGGTPTCVGIMSVYHDKHTRPR